MNSFVIFLYIALACISSTTADTINVKGKLTCNGRAFENKDGQSHVNDGKNIVIIAFKQGSTGVRTSNPKYRTNGWADGLNFESGPSKLDHEDHIKTMETNGLILYERLESGGDGMFLSGDKDAQLNVNAAPVFKIYNDCSATKVCWMTELPISSINAATPFDLGTIELTKLPKNFRVVSCFAAK